MIIVWILIYVTELIIVSWIFWNLWEILLFLTSSMITPGLIVYIIYYIKSSTARFENSTILRKYHIHEGLVGIILLLLGLVFLILYFNLLFLRSPFWKRFSYILLLAQIFSFALLYLGIFFFFRDWRDVLKLKFIESKDKQEILLQNNTLLTFNNITGENVAFFRIPKFLMYPIGIVLTILSINMVIYEENFLPERFFMLNTDEVICLGYILSFIAAALIGIDWLRIYKKFYPELYLQILKIIEILEKDKE